jgi:hypothetical protein
MTLRACVALLLGFLALLVVPRAQPAQAQGSGQPASGSAPPPRAYRYPILPYGYAPYGAPYSPDRFEEEVRPLPRSSTYRTLCVRLCDGYYFPISSAATQDTLAHDADVCSASCGTEARLFFHSSIGGDARSAVDFTGMAYSSLPNAFRYRKTLVEDCRCRPQPWSQSEAVRHRAYAEDQPTQPSEGLSGRRGTGGIEVIAGDYSRRSVAPGLPRADDDRGSAQPGPIVRNIEPILPERSLFGAGGWEPPRGPNAWPSRRRY